VITGGQANWQLMRYLSFPAWRATHDKFIYGYLNGSDSFAKNKAAQAGVELVATMGKSGYFQRGFTSTDYTSGVNLFFGGTGAIYYGGSGLIMNTSQLYKEGKLGMFTVPDVPGMSNMSTNVPIHAGFANAFNAHTYDNTMKEFLAYVVTRYTDLCLKTGLFSPFNDPLPQGLDPIFYEIQPLFSKAEQGWVSWDDKLDSATLTAMADAQQKLALGMLTPEAFIKEMDEAIKANRK
jgi:raffinose/stachyose/melibiose transport system substrate-binding protein